MAVILMQMPNDFCPQGCKQFEPDIDTMKLYAYMDVVEKTHTLFCKHEKICKLWVDKIDKPKED